MVAFFFIFFNIALCVFFWKKNERTKKKKDLMALCQTVDYTPEGTSLTLSTFCVESTLETGSCESVERYITCPTNTLWYQPICANAITCPTLADIQGDQNDSLCTYCVDELATETEQAAFVDAYKSTFGEDPQTVLNDWCFQTVDHCVLDAIYAGANINEALPMPLCSAIHSSGPLGPVCQEYYINHFDGAMEQRIQNFCRTSVGVAPSSQGCLGDSVCENACACIAACLDPESTPSTLPSGCNCAFPPHVPPGLSCNTYNQVPGDCQCVNRYAEPLYIQVKNELGLYYSDACWYKPCVNTSSQLMPSVEFLENNTCPTVVCASVAQIISNDENVNASVTQYVNCTSTEYQTTASVVTAYSQSIARIALWAFALLLVAFIFLLTWFLF